MSKRVGDNVNKKEEFALELLKYHNKEKMYRKFLVEKKVAQLTLSN